MITIHKVLTIQTYSGAEWRMFAFIVRECKRLGVHIHQDEIGNLYITKGNADTYPCIVAHMDSVHRIGSDLSIIEAGGKLTGFNCDTMQQSGIGGDDKVGIYIALRCLEDYDNIKVAFFVNEEQGCIGSRAADMTFFEDCRFVLQADRRGCTDFVVNASGVKLSSKKFKKGVSKIMTGFGYAFSDGMMTDVMQLKENGLKVSCANVSCGYYRPHDDDEYVVVSEVENTLSFFKSIIDNMTEVYEHKYTYSYSTPTYGKRNYDTEFGVVRGATKTASLKSKSKYDDYWASVPEAKGWRVKETEQLYYCDGCNETHTLGQLKYNQQYQAHLCYSCELDLSVWAK